MKYKTVGGGAATGLGNDFASFLQQGLNTGTFGAGSPAGYGAPAQAGGIAGFLNDVLSGGAGKLGGSLAKILQTQQTSDVANLRSRFGVGGGTTFGTPGAYAESTYRSQAAPQIATAIGGLQSNVLQQLLSSLNNIGGRGIPQAETVGVQSPWTQAAGLAAPVLGGILGGPAGAGIGSFLGGMFGGGSSTGSTGAGGFNFNMMPSNLNFGSMFQPQQGFGGGFTNPFGAGGNALAGWTPQFTF